MQEVDSYFHDAAMRRGELRLILERLNEWDIFFTHPASTPVESMLRVCDVCRLTPTCDAIELRFREESVHRVPTLVVDNGKYVLRTGVYGATFICDADRLHKAIMRDQTAHIFTLRLIKGTRDAVSVRKLVEQYAVDKNTSACAMAYKRMMNAYPKW